MTRKRSARRGFTLTELAIVMSVIGSIAGAIWWSASNARENQRDNDAVTQLQTVVQNLDTLMMGRSFTTANGTDLTSSMITSQVIPSSYVDKTAPTTADNVWGGSGTFILIQMAARQFQVIFFGVSHPGCLVLLNQATSCQAGLGCPVSIATATGSNTITPSATTGWQTVMTATKAASMCASNNYSGGTNAVYLNYNL